MSIRLTRNLALPIDAQTQTFVLLAVRGAGKTYACLKMAEGFYEEELQFVFVDPTGVCWGLRSSADGKKPGLPVLVLGGERGDIPLEVGSGALVADLVVDEGVSCVLDLSDFRKGQMTKFMCDFAERLYHRKRNRRDPLHIFMDEADAFAPQKPQKDQMRMLGAVEDLVRRGRSRGIGLTLATQRSAVLNKDVLTQCETLIAMSVPSPQDIKAVDEWLKNAGDEEKRAAVLGDLPNLDTGEAWFWSPRALKVFKRGKVLKRTTFDSSATPKAGKRAKAPKTVADVDLEAVRGQMAAVVERAEANDPKILQARIRQLEKELAAESDGVIDAEAVEMAMEAATAAERKRGVDLIRGVLSGLRDQLECGVSDALDGAEATLIEAVAEAERPVRKPKARARRKTGPVYATVDDLQAAIFAEKDKRSKAPLGGLLTPAKQRILDALAFLAEVGVPAADKKQLALFAGTSPKSSGYANNLGALRSSGFIDYPSGGTVTLTDDGREHAQSEFDVRTTDDLHRVLQNKLAPAKWRIVSACIDAYPKPLDKETLAERAGTSPKSSGYANNLGALRSLGLIDYPTRGHVVATDVLFLEGR